MGKNKNRNRRNKKIPSSKQLSVTSDGIPGPAAEGHPDFRQNVQTECENLFSDTSKTNAFEKPGSQTLPLVKDKTKLKIDQKAVNRSVFNVSSSTSSNFKENHDELKGLSTKNTESDKLSSVQEYQHIVSDVDKARSEKKIEIHDAKKFSTLNDTNNVFKVCNDLKKETVENKEGSLVAYSEGSSNEAQFLNYQHPSNTKSGFSCRNIQDTTSKVNMNRKVQGTVNKNIDKFYNAHSSGCLNTQISSGAKPKTKGLMNQTKCGVSHRTQNDLKDATGSLYESVKMREEKSDNFYHTYFTWQKEREETIKKLQQLVKEVHNNQHLFNQTNVFFKELNVYSREIKDSTAIGFLTSLAALATDVASGITCFGQACSIDNYMETFAKILEHDKEITEPLYAVRSLSSIPEYQNVEETLRKYHSDAFGGTLANISKELRLEELWSDIRGIEEKQASNIDGLDNFFKLNLNNETFSKVYNTIQDYTGTNPSALKACESAGKVCYDIYDAWHGNYKGTFNNTLSRVGNKMILLNERKEINELTAMASNEWEIQAKLESDINDAIGGLQKEMEEIKKNFKEILSFQ